MWQVATFQLSNFLQLTYLKNPTWFSQPSPSSISLQQGKQQQKHTHQNWTTTQNPHPCTNTYEVSTLCRPSSISGPVTLEECCKIYSQQCFVSCLAGGAVAYQWCLQSSIVQVWCFSFQSILGKLAFSVTPNLFVSLLERSRLNTVKERSLKIPQVIFV